MNDTLIHYPFYIGGYLKNTMSFTQEQRGAYIDLCVAYIQNDGQLRDDESLYILTRCFNEQNRTSVATVVERAFKRENGYINSEELNALIVKQKNLRQQRVEAGKKSAEKRAKNQRALQQSESESESELKPEPELESEPDLKTKPKKKEAVLLPYSSLPEQWRAFCFDEMNWNDEQSESAFVSFYDYWNSAEPKKAKKKDWYMTFKNSCRSGFTKPNINLLSKERKNGYQKNKRERAIAALRSGGAVEVQQGRSASIKADATHLLCDF